MSRVRVVRLAAAAAADLAVLTLGAPDFHRVLGEVTHPHAWVARAGADGACAQLATTAIWCVAAWVALGLLAVAASGLPGLGGRCAGRVTQVLVPRAVRTVLVGSTGLGVLLAPLAAAAAPAQYGPPGDGAAPASVVTSLPSAPSPTPTWPLDAPTGAARPVRTPVWPISSGPTSSGPTSSGPISSGPTSSGPTSSRPAPTGSTSAGSSHRSGSSAGPVTVAPGDSLWTIAARRLGPQASPARIAAAWPRWYAANRHVIGDDPRAITAGQVLHAPTGHGKEDS